MLLNGLILWYLFQKVGTKFYDTKMIATENDLDTIAAQLTRKNDIIAAQYAYFVEGNKNEDDTNGIARIGTMCGNGFDKFYKANLIGIKSASVKIENLLQSQIKCIRLYCLFEFGWISVSTEIELL